MGVTTGQDVAVARAVEVDGGAARRDEDGRLGRASLPRGERSAWKVRAMGGGGGGAVAAGGAASAAPTTTTSLPHIGGASSLVARVMAARGLDASGSDAAAFLEPALNQMHEPSLMIGMDRAATRLLEALKAGEPIAIYGDYDVDGVSATTILYHTLLALNPAATVTTYVPHRIDEGYGLNADAMRELAGRGHRVIVSVDCGVTALEPARVARSLGVDLIITDHHNFAGVDASGAVVLPDAYAVVHPRLGRDGRENGEGAYPFGELCGAAVAFKLAWRLATMATGSSRASEPMRHLLLEMLSLAALGVVADVVPLLGENRVIARFGLRRIKGSSLTGLRALVEASGLAGDNVNADDVGFKLGPRLNACGRMGHAREAVELFTTATPERAREIAEGLTKLNNKRRATEQAIFKQAVEEAEARGMTGDDRRAIVLAHDDWHQGVVGIVCSRLVERYHRPTILMARGEHGCHGSGRSIDGFSLHRALQRCASHLTGFGGHDMAAGVRVAPERVDAFAEAFVEVANEQIGVSDLVSVSEYDAEARIAELSLGQVEALSRLAPFGRCNPAPVLRVSGLRVETRPETFGKYNKHLSMRAGDGQGPTLRLVGWNWAGSIERVPRGTRVDALIKPTVSIFAGSANVEGELVDLRVLG